MEKILEVVHNEVSDKGRVFPNDKMFLTWLERVSTYRRAGVEQEEFYDRFQELVEAGSIIVSRRRGNIRVQVAV